MLLSIAFWLLVSLIGLWILLGPVTKVVRALWEIIVQTCNKKTVDLRTQFGEWAGKYDKLFFTYILGKNFIFLKFEERFLYINHKSQYIFV